MSISARAEETGKQAGARGRNGAESPDGGDSENQGEADAKVVCHRRLLEVVVEPGEEKPLDQRIAIRVGGRVTGRRSAQRLCHYWLEARLL